jgi:hypothetical protein
MGGTLTVSETLVLVYVTLRERGWLKVSIKIDLDRNRVNWRKLKADLSYALEKFGVKPKIFMRARSVGGWHVKVYTNKPVEPDVAVVVQMFVGSDRYRELFNYVRVKSGMPKNLLFTNREVSKWQRF